MVLRVAEAVLVVAGSVVEAASRLLPQGPQEDFLEKVMEDPDVEEVASAAVAVGELVEGE